MPHESLRELVLIGLLADVGKALLPRELLDHPGVLKPSDYALMQQHVTIGLDILSRANSVPEPVVRGIAEHHERLDGSGYHRSLPAEALSREDRILAAADVFAALTADRPHRRAFAEDEAARTLEAEAKSGLDADAVSCVLAAAGQRAVPSPARWPADLTDREVEVLRLIARGRSNREVAERLFISAKTVGRHVENVYAKIGVSSRAAAALFAMEHRLLD
jgi:HD-GYP domain-containing protein (c-di-GMP phosphodiesterase class II)